MTSMSNVDPAIAEIADQIVAAEESKAKAAGEIKDLKARAKEEGFNVKILAQIVKERRKGAQYQCDQLMLELELDTYRRGYGLPTEVEDAQARAKREAEYSGSDDGEPVGDAPGTARPRRAAKSRGGRGKAERLQ